MCFELGLCYLWVMFGDVRVLLVYVRVMLCNCYYMKLNVFDVLSCLFCGCGLVGYVWLVWYMAGCCWIMCGDCCYPS